MQQQPQASSMMQLQVHPMGGGGVGGMQMRGQQQQQPQQAPFEDFFSGRPPAQMPAGAPAPSYVGANPFVSDLQDRNNAAQRQLPPEQYMPAQHQPYPAPQQQPSPQYGMLPPGYARAQRQQQQQQQQQPPSQYGMLPPGYARSAPQERSQAQSTSQYIAPAQLPQEQQQRQRQPQPQSQDELPPWHRQPPPAAVTSDAEEQLITQLEAEAQNLATQIQVMSEALESMKQVHQQQRSLLRSLKSQHASNTGRERLLGVLAQQPEAQNGPKDPSALFTSMFR
eukprot:TRINITY_DN742_c0_g1_i3.p1 TRINITY_DN742_c0_g1~~TRINITY_DN742_c0_g1_i3.p1  ORF type:complete len:281 (+),score=127.35 TRINITY_DN742_c0_g1_i3:54-896(+)